MVLPKRQTTRKVGWPSFLLLSGGFLIGFLVRDSTTKTWSSIWFQDLLELDVAQTLPDSLVTPETKRKQPILLDPFVKQEAQKNLEQFCQEIQHEGNLPKDLWVRTIEPIVLGESEGFKMHFYNDKDIVSEKIEYTGQFESETTKRLAQDLQRFARAKNIPLSEVTFVDIGGNIGWHTLAMASLGVNVITFEPMESNLEALKRSLCANKLLRKRVTLFDFGLSNRTQTCRQYVYQNNIGNGITTCDPSAPVRDGHILKGEAHLRRLDDVILSTETVGAFKIDTEGFEPIILQGGQRFLHSAIPKVYAELTPHRLKAANPQLANDSEAGIYYLDFYFQAGYDVMYSDKRMDRDEALKVDFRLARRNGYHACSQDDPGQ